MSASDKKVLFKHRVRRPALVNVSVEYSDEETTPEESPWTNNLEEEAELTPQRSSNLPSHCYSPFSDNTASVLFSKDFTSITGQLLRAADVLAQIRDTMLNYQIAPDEAVVTQTITTTNRLYNNVENILKNVEAKIPKPKQRNTVIHSKSINDAELKAAPRAR